MYKRSFKGSHLHYIMSGPASPENLSNNLYAKTRARTPANNATRRFQGNMTQGNMTTSKSRAALSKSSQFIMFGSKFPLRGSTPNRVGLSKRQSIGYQVMPRPDRMQVSSQGIQDSGSRKMQNAMRINNSNFSSQIKLDSVNEGMTAQSQM